MEMVVLSPKLHTHAINITITIHDDLTALAPTNLWPLLFWDLDVVPLHLL